jgi:hypothetical protein
VLCLPAVLVSINLHDTFPTTKRECPAARLFECARGSLTPAFIRGKFDIPRVGCWQLVVVERKQSVEERAEL